MGDFTVVRAATLTLAALLRRYITDSADPQLATIAVDLRSPREMHDASDAQGISLWLYQVRRDPDLMNRPEPRPADDQRARRPIPLELCYLISPLVTDPETSQLLHGRVIEVFNNHPVLAGADLRDTLTGADDELRVHIDTEAMIDHTRLWHVLHLPYRLSIPYVVQHVTIDSELPPRQAQPVLHREIEYAP